MDILLFLIGPILLVCAILLAGGFLLRAWHNRTESTHAPYNVGKQEARVAMQTNIIWALLVVLVGGLLLAFLAGSGLLRPTPTAEDAPEPSPTMPLLGTTTTAVPAVPTSSPTASPIPMPNTPTPSTLIGMTPSPMVSPTPQLTDTPAPLTAVVSSGVGVWLRAAPSLEGEQLEWLLDGTQLILLENRVDGETFSWQQVQSPSGVTGWVALDFISISDT